MQLFLTRRSVHPLIVCVTIFSAPNALPSQNTIDEIVVSADLRGRTVSQMPASVTVLDADAISGLAVQHFEELIGALPNLNWSGDGNRARYLQLRGVGELAQYQGAPNPSVGFIIDDIDFSGIGTIATLFDIDRVEVLRGPQGTRYGANALAGLITMRSADPGDTFSGKFKVTAGDDDAYGAGVALGGPLGRDGGYRISVHHYQSNGFRDNAYLGRDDTNGRNETSLRSRFVWDSGSDWSFKVTGMLVDIDDGYDAFAIDNSLTVLSDKPGRDAQKSIGGSLRADWNGGRSFKLTSISAVADSDIDFSFDADWGNDDAWAPVLYDFVSLNKRQRRTLSQEIRLASTEGGRVLKGAADWLVGVYVNRMDEDLTTINRGEYFDPGFNFADSLDNRLGSQFEALNTAVFGQLDFAAGDAGKLTVGVRVERRSTDYTDSDGLDLGPSETMIGGEIAYTHMFNDSLSGFAVLSRGYKAGGFNLGFVPAGRREFEKESMWNIETGLKGRFADGRLLFNTAIFFSVRDDQQVETSFQLNPNDPASFVFFTDNAAAGNTIGLEADLRWIMSEALEIYMNVGLLRARFDKFTTPQVDLSGREQAHAPNYTVALGAVYRHTSGIFARIDYSAKDKFYFGVSHDQQSQPYSVTNARLGYEAERWTIQLWLRNAFDERYAVRGFYFGNEPPNFPSTLYTRLGDPRQLGLTFDMRF
jgi:iron complex outermembrane recepter protein